MYTISKPFGQKKKKKIAQSTGTVEYAECPVYDT